ncbi:MAG: S8 family serine peptidase [Planctomycetales bacterium]|nr:S8 family serine peptidase [Planctomycetales bacterium]
MSRIKRRAFQPEPLESRLLMDASADLAPHDSSDFVFIQSADIAGDTFGRARDLGTLQSSMTFVDRVGSSDSADVFRFAVDGSVGFSATLDRLTANIDLYVFNTSGERIARDTREGTASERVSLTLGSGDYYILLLPRGNAEGGYRLQLGLKTTSTPTAQIVASAPTSGDAGDTFRRATNIGSLTATTTRSESVGVEDKADVIRFQLSTRANVTVTLGNLTNDADVFIFDSTGQIVGRDSQQGRTTEQISESLVAGEYYVLVLPRTSSTVNYQLVIRNLASRTPVPQSPPTAAQLPVPLPNVANEGGSTHWNVNAVNAPEAWNAGFRGQGIVVAILDTGVDRTHPDLVQNIWRNPDERPGDGIDNDHNGYVDDAWGWSFVRGNNNVFDHNGHGTHVAGIVGASRNGTGATGIAPSVKLMPVAVMDSSGYGRTSNVARGIRYAVDNGADVINLSFLGTYSRDIFSALQYAANKNVLVAVAAGNSNWATPTYPARHSSQLSNVISVGAHSANYVRSSFSNRVGNSGAVQVDAPGQSIYGTVLGGRYSYYKGTSMATPHVSGIAALALSANPNLTAAQLRNYILQGATRRVVGSDSRGAVNAAITVPLARNHRASARADFVPSVTDSSLIVTQSDSRLNSDEGRVVIAAASNDEVRARQLTRQERTDSIFVDAANPSTRKSRPSILAAATIDQVFVRGVSF